MADELDELLDFLGDKREDVRQQAAEIVQGLTVGRRKLTTF